MQIDTIRSLFVFAGGMLAFLGAVLTFINNRLQQVQTTDEKQKIYAHSISIALFILTIGTGGMCWLFKSFWTLALLILLFFTVNCYWFVTSKAKLSRREIAILVGLASCFVMALMLAFVFDILKVCENFAVIIGKLER